jgi:hypothetical protein
MFVSVQEVEKEPGILRHGAGDIDERDQRGRSLRRRLEGKIDRVSAGPQRATQGTAEVHDAAARVRDMAAGDAAVLRQDERLDQPLCFADLVRTHLGEVLRSKDIAIGRREPGGDLTLDVLLRDCAALRPDGIHDARLARLRLVGPLVCRSDRRHLGDELLDQTAPAPEDAEGGVEDGALLVAGDEDGMEGPVQVLAAAKSGDLDRSDGRDHVARTDGKSGRPERAAEMRNVLREASVHAPEPAVSVRAENTFCATCQRPSTFKKLR